MKIAVLGGSFDPPHYAHLAIAKQIKEQLHFGQILLMPCFQHPFHKTLSPAKHRLAMTKLLENHAIKTSSFETKRPTVSYSIDTLTSLARLFPHDTFSWVLGSDQLPDFPKWKHWQTIINNFGLVIVPRNQTLEEAKNLTEQLLHSVSLPSTISFLHPQGIQPISSTIIRERVKHNQSIEGLVPELVNNYIFTNNLYQY